MDDETIWHHEQNCSIHGGDDHQVCWPRTYSSRSYERFVPSYNMPVTRRSKPPIWALLWRRIKKVQKKRMFFQFGSNSMRKYGYDPHSYSQNFDHGSMIREDPDDLSRSFSARFAVPSRIYL